MRARLSHLACSVLVAAAVLVFASALVAETNGQAAPPDTALTTIFVVRHAEKDTLLLGSDPPLSGAGFKRARELARVLEDAGVQAIYVTEFLRNRQTALPIATALSDSLRFLHGRDFATQARMLKERHRGGTALVIGHSDTVPQLVEALSGTQVRNFRSGEWDPIFVVTLGPGNAAKVVTLKYGEHRPGQ